MTCGTLLNGLNHLPKQLMKFIFNKQLPANCEVAIPKQPNMLTNTCAVQTTGPPYKPKKKTNAMTTVMMNNTANGIQRKETIIASLQKVIQLSIISLELTAVLLL